MSRYICKAARRKLAENIDNALLDADMSYGELGRRTGAARSTVMGWAKGTIIPSAVGIVLIAKAIGVPVTQLLDGIMEAKHGN